MRSMMSIRELYEPWISQNRKYITYNFDIYQELDTGHYLKLPLKGMCDYILCLIDVPVAYKDKNSKSEIEVTSSLYNTQYPYPQFLDTTIQSSKRKSGTYQLFYNDLFPNPKRRPLDEDKKSKTFDVQIKNLANENELQIFGIKTYSGIETEAYLASPSNDINKFFGDVFPVALTQILPTISDALELDSKPITSPFWNNNLVITEHYPVMDHKRSFFILIFIFILII